MPRSTHRRGFTLLELLLVIALISGLASIVILAAAPKKNFASAYDTLRKSDIREVVQALYTNLIDNWEMVGSGTIQEGEESAKPICKTETSAPDCAAVNGVSLNDLPPEYIAIIPIDPAEPEGSQCTGYFVYTDVGRPRAYSLHMGKLPGDVIDPSCGSLTSCPNGTCASGEQCAADCPTETHCDDSTDNDEDGDADCSDADCASDPSCASSFCLGVAATIYVNESNIIVGGPDDGDPYAGVLTGGNESDVIIGTENADIINSGNNSDIVCGRGGDDDIKGGNNSDTIDGGDGDDVLDGENASDIVCGGNGDDSILGGNSGDAIDGGTGTDTIDGQNGNDICMNGENLTDCEDTVTPVPECNP